MNLVMLVLLAVLLVPYVFLWAVVLDTAIQTRRPFYIASSMVLAIMLANAIVVAEGLSAT